MGDTENKRSAGRLKYRTASSIMRSGNVSVRCHCRTVLDKNKGHKNKKHDAHTHSILWENPRKPCPPWFQGCEHVRLVKGRPWIEVQNQTMIKKAKSDATSSHTSHNRLYLSDTCELISRTLFDTSSTWVLLSGLSNCLPITKVRPVSRVPQ